MEHNFGWIATLDQEEPGFGGLADDDLDFFFEDMN
jgi:hypothetical protein